MRLSLDDMAMFVQIADSGSFTGAAKELGVPKSTLSRRLSDFEGRVGSALFHRSTRALSLTSDGQRIYEMAKPPIETLRALSSTLIEHGKTPSGLVRLSTTSALAQHLLQPALDAFLNECPQVQIELLLTEARVNLIADGIDLAVRVGKLADSDLVARKFMEIQRCLVASPSLIAKVGSPSHPSDLTEMNCIVLSKETAIWRFSDDWQIPVKWRYAVGNMDMALKAALAGTGFAILPTIMLKDAFETGSLVPVLADYPLEPAETSLIAPRHDHRSAAAQHLIDFLSRWAKTQRLASEAY